MDIWYILCSFGTFFPVLVPKKIWQPWREMLKAKRHFFGSWKWIVIVSEKLKLNQRFNSSSEAHFRSRPHLVWPDNFVEPIAFLSKGMNITFRWKNFTQKFALCTYFLSFIKCLYVENNIENLVTLTTSHNYKCVICVYRKKLQIVRVSLCTEVTFYSPTYGSEFWAHRGKTLAPRGKAYGRPLYSYLPWGEFVYPCKQGTDVEISTIFSPKIWRQIGIFDSKQSYIVQIIDINNGF
jgi:hypothetical protein